MLKEEEGGMFTSEPQAVSLPLWSEVVGAFNGFSSDDSWICLKIDNKILCLPKDSIESEAAIDKLNRGR